MQGVREIVHADVVNDATLLVDRNGKTFICGSLLSAEDDNDVASRDDGNGDDSESPFPASVSLKQILPISNLRVTHASMGQEGRIFLIDEDGKGYLLNVNNLSESDLAVERNQCGRIRSVTLPAKAPDSSSSLSGPGALSTPSDDELSPSSNNPTIVAASSCCQRSEVVDSLGRVSVHVGKITDDVDHMLRLPPPTADATNSTTKTVRSPLALTLIPNVNFKVLKISCAPRHTLVATAAGVVLARGCHSKGRLGIAPTDSSSAGQAKVIDWENSPFLEVTSTTISHAFVVDVFAANANSIALTDRGKLFSWGDDSSKLLGYPTNGNCVQEPRLIGGMGEVKVERVSIGSKMVIAISNKGNVYCWGHLPRGVQQQRAASEVKAGGVSLKRRSAAHGQRWESNASDSSGETFLASSTPVTSPTLLEFFATNGMNVGGAWTSRKG